MARIFAYIVHKGGVADDTAVELVAAAKKIDPAASPTAVVTGCGSRNSMPSARPSPLPTPKSGRVANEALAYPNGELVRKALAKVVPHDSIVLVPHDHFGVDLCAGSLDQDGLSVTSPTSWPSKVSMALSSKSIRQEYGGQVSTHVRCDVSSGAVIDVRPGVIQAGRGCARERKGDRQIGRSRRC